VGSFVPGLGTIVGIAGGIIVGGLVVVGAAAVLAPSRPATMARARKPPDAAETINGPYAPGRPGADDGFKSPKGGDRWVQNPNGKGWGWEDANGKVWVP